jgi:hypothetical protein
VGWGWAHLACRPLVSLLYQPRMIGDECVAAGGMRTDRGNGSSRRKPAPVPFRPPQIAHDLTWARIRAAAGGSRRLTSRVTAWPQCSLRESGRFHVILHQAALCIRLQFCILLRNYSIPICDRRLAIRTQLFVTVFILRVRYLKNLSKIFELCTHSSHGPSHSKLHYQR